MMRSNGHRYKPNSIAMSPLKNTMPQAKMYTSAPNAATGSSTENDNEKSVESSGRGTPTNNNIKATHLAPVKQLTASIKSVEGLANDPNTVTQAQSESTSAHTTGVVPGTCPAQSIFGPGKPLVNFPCLSDAPMKKPAERINPVITSIQSPQNNPLAPSTPTTPR